jgi:formate dehydrogenase major subunit
MKPDAPPGTFGAFIMLPEGVGRLYAPALADGPFPEHYEAVEAPVVNALHPKVSGNPASKKFSSDKDVYGKKEDFPIVGTSYRLTEHFHYWTRHQRNGVLNELQPGFFVEVPEGVAMVTKRLAPLKIDGKPVWYVGLPIHWGFTGPERHQGPLANAMTPSAMDANTWTPEYKAFLLKIEKA